MKLDKINKLTKEEAQEKMREHLDPLSFIKKGGTLNKIVRTGCDVFLANQLFPFIEGNAIDEADWNGEQLIVRFGKTIIEVEPFKKGMNALMRIFKSDGKIIYFTMGFMPVSEEEFNLERHKYLNDGK